MSSVLQVTEKEDSLRLTWDNRHAPIDWTRPGCLLGFWVIWAPLTILLTWLLVRGLGPTIFLTLWLVFGWLGTLIIPYSLLGLWRSEWLEVTPTNFTVGWQGFLAPKPKTYPITPELTLNLGQWNSETVRTLSLFWLPRDRPRRSKRVIIAYWLRSEAQEAIHHTVAAFVQAHDLPLAIKPALPQALPRRNGSVVFDGWLIETHQGDAPPGFRVSTDYAGAGVIRYRARGMSRVRWFLGVWLTGWTIGCLLMTRGLFLGPVGAPQWFFIVLVLLFWAAEVLVLRYFFWFVFGVTEFVITNEELIVRRSLWWFRRQQVWSRHDLKVLRQVQDGGLGEDSFPSWALELVVTQKAPVRVLSRQSFDKSAWLGSVLADWAGVGFEQASPRP